MTSPFLTSEQAVAYLGLPSKKALYEHLRRHPIRVYHLGRNARYHIDDIQALIEFSHMSAPGQRGAAASARPSAAKAS